MKILVFGAGVLGSLYAARLQEAGNDVTILARGKRYEDIRDHGIVLENAETGLRTVTSIDAVNQLTGDMVFDLALVIVRKNQLSSALSQLALNRQIPDILFMLNNAAGPDEMISQVGRERVILGFPGAGGQRDGFVVKYLIAPANSQPTTLGELDGPTSERIKSIARLFNSAGFPVAICPNMDAWLKTHVTLVSPIANAVYMAGGDNYRLARTRDACVLVVRAVREGFRVLHRLEIPITPSRYKVLKYIPEPLLVMLLQRGFATPNAELALARHANAARDEMTLLANEFRALAEQACLPTPSVDTLYEYLAPETPPAPEEPAEIQMDWSPVWGMLGLAAAAMLTILFYRSLKRKNNARLPY